MLSVVQPSVILAFDACSLSEHAAKLADLYEASVLGHCKKHAGKVATQRNSVYVNMTRCALARVQHAHTLADLRRHRHTCTSKYAHGG